MDAIRRWDIRSANRWAKALVVLAIATGSTAGTTLAQTEVAGFYHAVIPARGRALIANPLMPFDGQAVVGLSWNALDQRYDATSGARAGTGRWIANNSEEALDLYLCGRLPLVSEVRNSLLPGLNAIGYPFACSFDFQRLALAGAEKGDMLVDTRGNQYAWSADGWTYASNAPGPMQLQIGEALWYLRQKDAQPVLWSEVSPYSQSMTQGSSPGIIDIRVDSNAMAIVRISLPESTPFVDIFCQDVDPMGCFSPTNGWELVTSRLPTFGKPQIEWVDRSEARAGPAMIRLRLYTVADANLDNDLDGVSDARERLLAHTDPFTSAKSEDVGSGALGADDGASVGGDSGSRGVKIYVNAITGDDLCDGFSATRATGMVGPKRTLKAAVAAIDRAGVIVVTAGQYLEDLNVGSDKQIRIETQGLVSVAKGLSNSAQGVKP